MVRKCTVVKAAGYRVKRCSVPESRLRALERHATFNGGLTWYHDAQATVAALASLYGHAKRLVAGVVAVLSPRQSVRGNLTLAKRILAGDPNPGGFRTNVAKAQRVLQGDLDAIKGPKVEAFYRALQGEDALVLDSWAIRAAIGKDTCGPKTREKIEALYHKRAKALGITPSAYQAGIWVAMRSECGFSNSALMSECL